MARELLLMRHAKSDWDSAAASDFERPLNKRGRQTAPKIGRWLSEQGLIPDYIVSSPAKRAAQTVAQVCSKVGFSVEAIGWDRRIYEASVPTLLTVLADCPAGAQRVLLVGHNPGLENLLVYLCAEVLSPVDGKLMPTAAIARLAMPDAWGSLARGSARLLSLMQPRSLPALR